VSISNGTGVRNGVRSGVRSVVSDGFISFDMAAVSGNFFGRLVVLIIL
jgi:hypothetical protein